MRSLEKLGRDAIDCAVTMQHRVLKPAVFAYALGAHQDLLLMILSETAWAGLRFESMWTQEYFLSFPHLVSFDEEKERTQALGGHFAKIALKVLQETEEVWQPLRPPLPHYYRGLEIGFGWII